MSDKDKLCLLAVLARRLEKNLLMNEKILPDKYSGEILQAVCLILKDIQTTIRGDNNGDTKC